MKFANEKEFQDFMRGKQVKEHGSMEDLLRHKRQGKPCAAPAAFPKGHNPLIHSGGFIPPKSPESPKKGKRGKGPNKTEASYMAALGFEFPGCRIRFEAVTFHLPNDASYTPDIEVVLPDGNLLYVEVKNGAYRHASYGRSKIAFADARICYPQFRWRWAELVDKEWCVKEWETEI